MPPSSISGSNRQVHTQLPSTVENSTRGPEETRACPCMMLIRVTGGAAPGACNGGIGS